MMGDPVASKRSIVSLIAASYCASSFGSAILPWDTASISAGGLGMLPIGSVGRVIATASSLHAGLRRAHRQLRHRDELIVRTRKVYFPDAARSLEREYTRCTGFFADDSISHVRNAVAFHDFT